MNKEQKTQYLKDGGLICPFCQSNDMFPIGSVQFTGDRIIQEVECANCGEEWKDFYQLIGVQDE